MTRQRIASWQSGYSATEECHDQSKPAKVRPPLFVPNTLTSPEIATPYPVLLWVPIPGVQVDSHTSKILASLSYGLIRYSVTKLSYLFIEGRLLCRSLQGM